MRGNVLVENSFLEGASLEREEDHERCVIKGEDHHSVEAGVAGEVAIRTRTSVRTLLLLKKARRPFERQLLS